MKINTNINPDLLHNDELFHNDFFKRFNLRHAPTPLELTTTIKKNYLFPTLYKDVVCSVGIFFCSYSKAKEILPDTKMLPISMGKGRALVIFSHYIYNHVLGIPPYNEVAMTIPVIRDAKLNLPVLPLLLPKLFSGMGYYCFSMPVTSLENQIRGQKIWGLPKIVQEIEIVEKDGFCLCEIKDEKGIIYYRSKIPLDGRQKHFDVSASLYSKKNDNITYGKTCFQGDFLIQKKPKKSAIELFESPCSAVLKRLEINPIPFQTRFCRSQSSSFDLPEMTKI